MMRVMPARTLNTVVFVDIVESTRLAATIGDGPWAALLERFQELVRRELRSTGGDEMDNAGDGFFAVFSDPAASVSFGRSIVRAVEALGLRVRVGIHTGTCWVAGEKCSGLTVNVGARIVAGAQPSEVLVSAAVKEHLAGDPRFEFRGRGQAELNGVPGSWSLYAVVDRAGGALRARGACRHGAEAPYLERAQHERAGDLSRRDAAGGDGR
jgi:class 3 adenylate cyclase